MLAELRIRDFAIIEQIDVQFGPGLNVLSGETGAGKTIIMNALGLLLGARASTDVIRASRKEAVVEAVFDLNGGKFEAELVESLGLEADAELLIRRAVGEGGRSRATLNQSLATVQMLSRVGSGLVQVYGQHEQQSLLRVESHLTMLDRYAGIDVALEEYRSIYRRALELRAALEELERRQSDRERLLELARFQVAELEKADVRPGEDEELNASRAILANAAKLSEAVRQAEELLSGSDVAAAETTSRAHKRISDASAIDPRLREPLDLIESARTGLEEAAHRLRGYAEKIESDPARLDAVDSRLQELSRLKRKYGGTLDSTLETLDRARAEIAELEGIAENRAERQAELQSAIEHAQNMAKELSARRQSAASDLKRKMEQELKTLGMRNAAFESRVAKLDGGEAELRCGEVQLGPNGCDAVEFHIAPNLGQPPLPLARIASGGELSRVMLALKRLEAQRRGVATLIFDEVDAGIGGAVAEAVGRKLKELARFHQVLCITHLPQIAAFADKHFVVEKLERRAGTLSRISELDRAARVEELARMLGGAEITDKLRKAARELLEGARL